MFKILVAEDDAELRQLFCRVLTRHGFQPIGAADGVEALQVLERDYIDLIVSDIMMPQLDGYALVRGLRDSGNTIPVLMITARDGFQDMQFGFLAGADDYLVKPINVNELVLRINALLRRAQMVADRRQTLGTTTFEFDSFSVLTGGVQTVLPQKEFLLLYKLVSSPGHSMAMWLNQLSFFAPCQCLTLAGIITTLPSCRLTAALPSSWYQPSPAVQIRS